jgi:hypothetical protein
MELKKFILIIFLLLILKSLLNNNKRKEKFNKFDWLKKDFPNGNLAFSNINIIKEKNINNLDKIFSSSDLTLFVTSWAVPSHKLLNDIIKISQNYSDIKISIIDLDLINRKKLSDNDKKILKKIYGSPTIVTKNKEFIPGDHDIEKLKSFIN